jgi:HlyD family secretion protein
MKRKAIIIVAVIAIAAVVVGTLVRQRRSAGNGNGYQLAEVTRGDIENTVSSTGTLSAVRTVEVGAQVSGIIDSLYVDFNSAVRKDQVLAVLDTTLFAAQVLDARAGLMRAKAQLLQAESEFKRNKPLFENGFLAESEWLVIKTTYEAARASYESAAAALERAKTNLTYTTIRSPIDGTIIERNVDLGQTIAASFQAPKLFVIAQDLSKMQIDVNVDESDIGSIKAGMDVRFSVQAYPDETFTGTVRQVRLQPTTIQNVVNYTAVVDASNERGLLLPGMTATVDFIIASKKDVLLVPNTALTFKPPDELVAELKERMQKRMAEHGAPGGAPGTAIGQTVRDSASGGGNEGKGERRAPGEGTGSREGTGRFGGTRAPGGTGGFAAAAAAGSSGTRSRVFYIDSKGAVAMAFVTPGTTDGRNTEIVGPTPLAEGTQVITGVSSAAPKAGSRTRFSLNPDTHHGPPGVRRGGRF